MSDGDQGADWKGRLERQPGKADKADLEVPNVKIMPAEAK